MIPTTMLFGFLTAVAGFVAAPPALLFSWVSWALLQYELSAIGFFAAVPFASISFSIPSGILLLPLYGLIGYWVFRKNKELESKNEN